MCKMGCVEGPVSRLSVMSWLSDSAGSTLQIGYACGFEDGTIRRDC